MLIHEIPSTKVQGSPWYRRRLSRTRLPHHPRHCATQPASPKFVHKRLKIRKVEVDVLLQELKRASSTTWLVISNSFLMPGYKREEGASSLLRADKEGAGQGSAGEEHPWPCTLAEEPVQIALQNTTGIALENIAKYRIDHGDSQDGTRRIRK